MERIQSELKAVASQITPRTDALPAVRRRVTLRKRVRAGVVVSGLALAAAALVAVMIVSAADPLPQTAASKGRVHVIGHVIAAESDATNHLWMLSCRNACGASNSQDQLVSVSSSSVPQVEASVTLAGATGLSATDTGVWVISFLNSTLTHIAPDGSVLSETQLSLPQPIAGTDTAFLPNAVAPLGDVVWVSTARGELAKVDASSGKVLSYTALPPETPGPLIGAFGALWSVEGISGVFKLDSTTGVTVNRIPIADSQGNVLAVNDVQSDGTTLWAVGPWAEPTPSQGGYGLTDAWAVVPIDPATGKVGAPVSVAPFSTLVAGPGALAVVDRYRQIEMKLSGSHLVKAKSPLSVVGVAGSRLWGVDESGVLTAVS